MRKDINNFTEVIGISNELPLTFSNFKEVKQKKIFNIENHEIKKVLRSIVKIEITNYNASNSFEGVSFEGKSSTKTRLHVEGQINNRIDYISNDVQSFICTKSTNIPFYTNIMLDNSFDIYSKFKITPYVEDIFVYKISNKKILQNILFIIAVTNIT